MTPPVTWRAKEAGLDVFEDRAQIIATRSRTSTPGFFDDFLHVVWKDDKGWHDHMWPCTVDPGVPWLLDPMNPNGTARLAPGQYRFKLGLHNNAYECLVQDGPVTVLRDNNRNEVIDEGVPDTGNFAIQVHRASASGTSVKVGKWSAGCIVLPRGLEDVLDMVRPTIIDKGYVTVAVLEDA